MVNQFLPSDQNILHGYHVIFCAAKEITPIKHTSQGSFTPYKVLESHINWH